MKKIVILMGLLGFLAACDAPGTSSTMVSPVLVPLITGT